MNNTKDRNRPYDNDWKIEYNADDNSLTIRTIDYHAEPLRLTLDMLKAIVPKFFALAVSTSSPGRSQTSSLEVELIRKEKCVSINIPDGWSGPLKITRKELYRLGRSLGKKTREKPGPLIWEN